MKINKDTIRLIEVFKKEIIDESFSDSYIIDFFQYLIISEEDFINVAHQLCFIIEHNRPHLKKIINKQ